MKRLGVMLDVSRNAVMKPNEVKNFATIIKSFGYNTLQLYTEDTYEIEGEPYFGYMRGRYTTEELSDIVKYCEKIGMEVIPCIQTLAHLDQIFRWKPFHDLQDVGGVLLADYEKTYALIDKMFSSLRKSFTSKYVNIGMDEAHLLGLGRYLEKHGFQNGFDILHRHLEKVLEIANKYGFQPIMWSDMFFRLANQGDYYPANPTMTEEAKSAIPQGVGLIYWDYYHDSQEHYEKLLKAHLQANCENWFAGGVITWTGFTCANCKTLDAMMPAVNAVKNCKIDNVFFTMWGDNGKECSFYSVLPALFTLAKTYFGETDIAKIKQEFFVLTGEDYDKMMALDLPNYVSGNTAHTPDMWCIVNNVSKFALYNDPFMGLFDTTLSKGFEVRYAKLAKTLKCYGKESRNYRYIFDAASALCRVLALKYNLGVRTRAAYVEKDKKAILKIAKDYERTAKLVLDFHDRFSKLWHKENKPNGFEVQDIRLGGLAQRLRSCKIRLIAWAKGRIDEIPELEEEVLDINGGGKIKNEDPISYNSWTATVSVNAL